jgi:hypothetical protein
MPGDARRVCTTSFSFIFNASLVVRFLVMRERRQVAAEAETVQIDLGVVGW